MYGIYVLQLLLYRFWLVSSAALETLALRVYVTGVFVSAGLRGAIQVRDGVRRSAEGETEAADLR